MCRMLAIVGRLPTAESRRVFREFRKLSECGVVPTGSDAGHHDGWGVVAYLSGKRILYRRHLASAAKSKSYLPLTGKVAATHPDLVVVHFRKASVGNRSIHNTHPFILGPWSFCHNGSVMGIEKLSVARRVARVLGQTDSGRIFEHIESLLPRGEANHRSIREAIMKTVGQIKKVGYTALNSFLTDGKDLWVLREANDKDAWVRDNNLVNKYYTLFVASRKIGGKTVKIICSQKLDLPGWQWRLIPNHKLMRLVVPVSLRA